MTDQIDYHEVESVICSIDGIERVCTLEQTSTPDSHWTLVLTAPDGTTWTGAGQGLWTAFIELRRQATLFDYAPAGLVTPVDEQLARYDRWIDTPWWRALLPGDPVR